MRVDVLEAAADSEMWQEALSSFPPSHQDIYFTPKYYQLHQANGDGQGRLFLAQDGQDTLFYPFLIREIPPIGQTHQPEAWQDIETAYGYGGPVATSTQPEFLSRSWAAFHEWCVENHVVSEFVRLNPLIGNQEFISQFCDLKLDRGTVAMQLDLSAEELWQNYPSGQRSKVQKALNGGLECKEVDLAEGLDRFRALYLDSMRRLNASAYYDFSDAYFDYLGSGIAENLRLFEVRQDTQLLAGGLFLIYGSRVHYHFGASDTDHWETRPNNLLFHTVALWGIERGFQILHLGGGRTPAVDDGLFQFKSSLSKIRLPFYLGTRVHNQPAYDSLCETWQRESEAHDKPSYFQLYRLPIANQPPF